MARTTPELLKKIIDHDAVSFPDLEPWITTANELVTELLGSSAFSSTRLELIERWLAAHFYTIIDPQRISETVGPVSEWFQFKVGLNLNQTRYGQQVLVLDTTGAFAALNNKAADAKTTTAGIVWLGNSCD